MNKKNIKKEFLTKTTSERLRESMTPLQRKKHDEDYQDLLLSELLIAITQQSEMSVRKLAKEAGISPTIVQAMRSGENKNYTLKSFFKVLKVIGYDEFSLKHHGKKINLQIPKITKTK
ncbi:hypothetical protein KBB68_03285 [Candidatus Babeliales bacterium]|nr:hypothetical protein [Candidatus Babeliales bacterium]